MQPIPPDNGVGWVGCVFGILHRARVKSHVAGVLKPHVRASVDQCHEPNAIDWLAPNVMGVLYGLIVRHVWAFNDVLSAADCEVVAVRVYDELSGVAGVFITAALKVHRNGSNDRYKEAAAKAERLFAVMQGRLDTSDTELRLMHEEAKALLAGPLGTTQRRAVEAWPRQPGWHVAFLLWQRCVTDALACARHSYGEPPRGHPSLAVRRKIARALEQVGVRVADRVPVVFAGLAAADVAAAILLQAGVFIELTGATWSAQDGTRPAQHDDRLIAGVLAFHVQREIARRLDIEVPQRFSRALCKLFGDLSQTECLVLLREVEQLIAKLADRGAGKAIENTIGEWIDDPDCGAFDKLLRLHGVLTAHAPVLKAA